MYFILHVYFVDVLKIFILRKNAGNAKIQDKWLMMFMKIIAI